MNVPNEYGRTGYRHVIGNVGSKLQARCRIGAALMQLTRGVEEPRPVAHRGGRSCGGAKRVADSLQTVMDCSLLRQIRHQRNVVAGRYLVEEPAQRFRNRFTLTIAIEG